MEERLVSFFLFGQEYTFYSDAPEEEVVAVLELLREELERGEEFMPSAVPSTKVLVLGCLRMAAKYMHLQREHERYCQAQEQLTAGLIEKILRTVEP
ncbi:cell division protein ZapA [Desulfobulbus rhabdoformis]|jgi:cell division protein ZapA|uniref:cell division protein ZapA n=1 Tax=Desulfobulbus rhabdoformis TaxID=34032 RepID=UPI0019626A05|nr:cell division protein ZapA [Desulfobulbus rhabdoformis]MBM9614315.1 cell division protein ZapA [Desulfobulbus rhabdoformis]